MHVHVSVAGDVDYQATHHNQEIHQMPEKAFTLAGLSEVYRVSAATGQFCFRGSSNHVLVLHKS